MRSLDLADIQGMWRLLGLFLYSTQIGVTVYLASRLGRDWGLWMAYAAVAPIVAPLHAYRLFRRPQGSDLP